MREDLLVELALFETVGSDPWRLFLGTSDVRLREMSTRASLQSLLRIATRAVLQALEHVKGPVRFAGQDYRSAAFISLTIRVLRFRQGENANG